MIRKASAGRLFGASISVLGGLALSLAGCGSARSDVAGSTGGGGQTGGGGGQTGGGGGQTGGSAGAGGTGGGGGVPEPAGVLCDEVKKPAASCTPNNYHDPLVSFVANSSLIFHGAVTALHETTPGIDVPDKTRTIVAKVDAVLYDGGNLVMGGQSVTVQLLAAPTMAVGYEGYFFTQIWTLGMSIGVTEVAHVDPGVYPTLESDVPGIEKLLADERLYARMTTAGAVVVGTVTKVTPLPDKGPGSEHDPLWADAAITADCTLRGAKPATLHTAFATSLDVAWAGSPKLQAGQKGIFLLQPSPSPPLFWGLPDDIPYVVTSPLDVLAPEERAHVATLVLCPPSH